MKKLLLSALVVICIMMGRADGQPYGVVGFNTPANIIAGQTANASVVGAGMSNVTLASNGNQQFSPYLLLEGEGWGTTLGTSQAVDFKIEVQPSQSTAPTGTMVISSSIAGGAYGNLATLNTAGQLGANQFAASSYTLNANGSAASTLGMYRVATNTIGFGTAGSAAGVVDLTQHWRLGGTAATTIGSGNCGATTNGTIAAGGNDHAGEIIIASAATTSCQVSFSGAYATVPRAVLLTPGNSAAAGQTANVYVSAIAVGSFTITGTALASTDWYYWVQ